MCTVRRQTLKKKKKNRNIDGLSLFSGVWEKHVKHFIILSVKLLLCDDFKVCLLQPAIGARGLGIFVRFEILRT